MKIWIESDSLSADNNEFLAANALSSMKILQKHGHELSTDPDKLSDFQKDLMKNEEVVLAEFKKNEADALISGHSELQFVVDEQVTEHSSGWDLLTQRILFPTRKAEIKRETRETNLFVALNLDGTGESEISTGLKFFDHMLEQIARHGLIDLTIQCEGDLEVDEHHSVEDTAITLGQTIKKALTGNKSGIQRYGFVLPMDEAEAIVSIDLSDRPFLKWDVSLKREYIGDLPTEMIEHFFYSLAMNAGATLHVTASGKNEHHIVESIFKGFAKALRFAVSRSERTRGILPTTKGKI